MSCLLHFHFLKITYGSSPSAFWTLLQPEINELTKISSWDFTSYGYLKKLTNWQIKILKEMTALFTNGIIYELLKSLFHHLVFLWSNKDKSSGDAWTHTHVCFSWHQDRSIIMDCFDGIFFEFFTDRVFINFYVHCIYVVRSSTAITVIA